MPLLRAHLLVVGVAEQPTARSCSVVLSYCSERLVFATYFSAGLRVYDLADPAQPEEVAHWIPELPPGQPVAQLNDLFVNARA